MLVETIYRDDHFETCNDDCNNDIPCEECCEYMVTEYEDAIRADERKKTLEFVSKHGSTIVVGGRNADARRRYWVEVMLHEMKKQQEGEQE